jgi:hypothetical protein
MNWDKWREDEKINTFKAKCVTGENFLSPFGSR